MAIAFHVCLDYEGEKGTWPGNVAQFGGAVVQRVGQY